MRQIIGGTFTVTTIEDGESGAPAPSYHVQQYAWSSVDATANSGIAPSDVTTWSDAIPTKGEKPYLWMRDTYRVWSGTEYVTQTVTYARLTGESGTGFRAKGSVASVGNLPPTGNEVGDAYFVEDVGHLYVWSGTGWQDFGEIKGDAGLSSYIHLAWAHAVGTNGYPEGKAEGSSQEGSAMGFSVSKNPTDNFEYMGVLVDNTQDDSLVPSAYEWNRINGSVFVDLDNNNDTMLYSGETLVSGEVISNGTLYVGGSPVTSGVSWKIGSVSKTGSDNNVTASVDTGGKVTVTAMTAASGWVIVTATFSGVEYSDMLTLKRSSDDKYDILPSITGIGYNITTNTPAQSTVTFQIRKTDITGAQTYITSIPSGGILSLAAYGIDAQNSRHAITPTPTYKDGAWSFVGSNSAYVSYYIELRKNGNFEDGETIPITKSANGSNGADAVSLTLTPASVNVAFTAGNSGVCVPDQDFPIAAFVYVGGNQATVTDVTATAKPAQVGIEKRTEDDGANIIHIMPEEGYVQEYIVGEVSLTVTYTYNGLSNTISGLVAIGAVYNGANGKDSIRLDLDNEADAMQYSSGGDKITSSVITHARLYDGYTLVTSGITWAHTAVGLDRITDGSFERGVKPYTVNSMSAATGTLTIKATYKGVTYQSVFSVTKLVNQDKYQLLVHPNAIAINTDEQQTPSEDVVVEVVKFPANGGSPQSISTLADGLALHYTTTDKNGIVSNPIEITSLFRDSYTIPKGDINVELVNYRFILRKSGFLCDSETLPIAKVANGESNLYADLTNEMDSVPMTYDGKAFENTSLSTTVKMYYGSQAQTLTSLDYQWEGKDKNAGLKNGVTVSKDLLTGVLTVGIATGVTLDNDKAVLHIISKCAKGEKTVDFTINGVRAGKEGDSPTIYQLNPSVTAIKKSKDGTISPTSVSCTKLRRIGNGAPQVVDDSTVSIYYSVNGGSEQPYESAISIDADTTEIVFRMYQGASNSGTLIDVESVPVVADGADGAPGQGINAIRLDIDNEMDSMQYKTTAAGLVKVTASVSTKVTLYDGNDKVEADSKPSVAFAGCSGSLGNYSNDGYLLTVSSMSEDADKGTATVTATYNGVTYSAVFTVKRLVDKVKYELAISPTSIGFNTSTEDFSTNPILRVSARKYDIDGTGSDVTNLKDEKLHVSIFAWDGSVYSERYAGQYNGKTITYDLEQDVYTGDYYEFYVELRKESATGELYDHENIPISSVRDGSSVSLDVRYCPDDGTENPDETKIHTTFTDGDIYMSTKKSNSSAWGAWVRIVGENGSETDYSFGISAQLTTSNAQTAPSDVSTWKDAPMVTTSEKPYLWAKVQRKDGNGEDSGSPYYIRMTGEPRTEYGIVSTAETITIPKDATSTTFNARVSLYKYQGSNQTLTTAYWGWYSRVGSTYRQRGYNITLASSQDIDNLPVTLANYEALVVFAFKTQSIPSSITQKTFPTNIYASLEIPVHKQGDTGGPGENAVRIHIDNQADIISCDADGKVRYNRAISTTVTIYDGASPATSEAVTRPWQNKDMAIGGVLPSITTVPSDTTVPSGFKLTWSFTTNNTIPQNVDLTIPLTYKGNSYSAVFSLAVTNSTAIYQLKPSPSAISLERAADGVSIKSGDVEISFDVERIDADGSESIGNVEDMAVYWGYDDSTSSMEECGDSTTISNSTLSSHNNITMALHKVTRSGDAVTKGSLIDKQQVPITKDGMKGNNGKNAVTYRILVAESAASISAAGRLKASIKFRVVKNDGGIDSYINNIASDCDYVLSNGTSGSADEDSSTYIAVVSLDEKVSRANMPTSIEVRYLSGNTPIATATIPITIEGQMGRNFYFDGEWDAAKVYTVNDFSAPFVSRTIPDTQDGEHTYYYVLNTDNGSYRGSAAQGIIGTGTPETKNNAYWSIMTNDFKYLITEAIFTDFAKLGSAVFNGDYMFSQQGYVRGYEGVQLKDTSGIMWSEIDPEDIEAQNMDGHIIKQHENHKLSSTSYASVFSFDFDDESDEGDTLEKGKFYTLEIDITSAAASGDTASIALVDTANVSRYLYDINGNRSSWNSSDGLNKLVLDVSNEGKQTFLFQEVRASNVDSYVIKMKLDQNLGDGGYVEMNFYLRKAKFTPSLYMNLLTGQMVANDLTARGMLYASSVGYSKGRVTAANEYYPVNDESVVIIASTATEAKVLLPEPTSCPGRVIEIYNYASGNWYFGQRSRYSGSQYVRIASKWTAFTPITPTTTTGSVISASARSDKYLKAMSVKSDGNDFYEWLIFD